MKLKAPLIAAAVAGLVASSAFAEFSFNVGAPTSYVFRGLNQSDFKPALQGGIDYSHESGFYVGTWASSIRWLKDFGISKSKVETDFYAGFAGEAGDFGYDVGFLRYEYWSKYAGAVSPNTNEVYVSGSWKWLTLKYSHTLSNAFGNFDSKNSGYIDLTAEVPLSDALTLTLHGGYQRISGPLKDDASYADGKVELAYDFGNGFTASGGVTFTDADKNFYTPAGKKFVGKTTPYLFVGYSKSF